MMHGFKRGVDYDQSVYPLQISYKEAGGRPEFFLTLIGLVHTQGSFSRERVGKAPSFHYVLEGKSYFEADGKRYNLKAGDLFMVSRRQKVLHGDIRGVKSKYIWFRFGGRRAVWALGLAGLARKTPYCPLAAGNELNDHILKMLSEFESGVYSPVQPAMLAWEFVETCIRCRKRKDRPRFPRNIAEACRVLIQDQYATDVSVDALAKHFKVSRTTLFRSFKQTFNSSPKTYLDQIRLEKSQYMLKESWLSVKEVAAACGFTDQCYFSRAFKQKYGCSPTEWRNKTT